MWQELVSPFVVVELLSPGTEAEDLGQTMLSPKELPSKWQVYEQVCEFPTTLSFAATQIKSKHFVL
jgi:Uma2 family endonuclease